MSDEATVLEKPAGTETTSTPTPTTTPSAETPPSADAPQADDWRKMIAGDDAKRLEALQRYSTLQDYDKAFRDTQAAFRERPKGIQIPKEGASEEEVKAFHDALGVKADVSEYEITAKLPENLSDADQAFLDTVKKTLHAKGGYAATPEVMNTAVELYGSFMEEQAAVMAATAAQKEAETRDALKQEFGAQLDLEMQYAKAAVGQLFGEEFDGIAGMQFADGTRLGDHPKFIKAMMAAGRAIGTEDPTFVKALTGDSSGGAQTLQDRIAEIQKLRLSSDRADQKRYAEASAPGGELQTLMGKLERFTK